MIRERRMENMKGKGEGIGRRGWRREKSRRRK
jgi:hypothetical protein